MQQQAKLQSHGVGGISGSGAGALGRETAQRPQNTQLSTLWRRAEKKYSVCRKDHVKRLFTRHGSGTGGEGNL